MFSHFSHILLLKILAAFFPVFCCAYSFAQHVNPILPSALYIPEITKEQQAAKINSQRQVRDEALSRLKESKVVNVNESKTIQRKISNTDSEMQVIPIPTIEKETIRIAKPARTAEKKYVPN